MSSNSRRQLEAWLKTIDVKGVVLDIGGCQNPIKGRTKTYFPSEYFILDLPVPHEQKSDVHFVCDIQDPNCLDRVYRLRSVFDGTSTEDVEEEIEFDQIFCLEVSEYWIDPMMAIRNISKMLKVGGRLYISFHFIYPVHEPKEEDCLRYTHHGVEKLLRKNGLEIDRCIDRMILTGKDSLFSFYAQEGMRLSKAYGRHNAVGCLVEATKVDQEVGSIGNP